MAPGLQRGTASRSLFTLNTERLRSYLSPSPAARQSAERRKKHGGTLIGRDGPSGARRVPRFVAVGAATSAPRRRRDARDGPVQSLGRAPRSAARGRTASRARAVSPSRRSRWTEPSAAPRGWARLHTPPDGRRGTPPSGRSAVECRLGEIGPRLTENHIRPPQFAILLLHDLQPLAPVGRQPRTFSRVEFVLAHPTPQRLGGAPELRRNGLDHGRLRRMVSRVVSHHTYGVFTYLRLEPARSAHYSIFSRNRAFNNLGAVQSHMRELGQRGAHHSTGAPRRGDRSR